MGGPELQLMDGGVTSPGGFLAGAVAAGIKHPGTQRLDVGMLLSERLCAAAGVFTTNRVVAAPLILSRQRLQRGVARGVVFNSGNANACTGEEGIRVAEEMARLAAEHAGVAPEEMLVASTGVIGVPFPLDRFASALPSLALSGKGGHDAALSIMTTDTVSKEVAVRFSAGGTSCVLGGMAKGAGMIHPNMATMLGFLACDAAVDPSFLQEALREAVDRSFNMITVDGDTSTSDTVIVLANGVAGNSPITSDSPSAASFRGALALACTRLARAIAADGEGATRLVEVSVRGGASDQEARLAARTVAGSNLLKAAVHGADPNWGRVMAALGYSGVRLDPHTVDIDFGAVPVARRGVAVAFDRAVASDALRQEEVRVAIDLHLGQGRATAWGCDLSAEYVAINSEYTT